MNIISFHDGHTATASLIRNGQILACVSEERFTRNKCQMGYPRNSINYCLNQIKNEKIDHVIVNGKRPPDPIHIRTSYSNTFSITDLIDLQHNYFKPMFIEGKNRKETYYKYFKNLFDHKRFPSTGYDGMDEIDWSYDPDIDRNKFRAIQINTICKHFNINQNQIKFIEHHPAHAAYAYFASPFRNDDTLIFTLDGIGEDINATISVCKKDRIFEEFRTGEANLGRLWKYITLLLGMMPDQHEFKIMGLAPYASYQHSLKVVEIFEKNFLYIDGIKFKYTNKPKDLYFSFKNLLEGSRFDNIAGGLQLYTEKLIGQWIKNAINKFQISRVVFSGGVSMNIKLNKVIASLPEVKEFYVSPSGGDETTPLGVYYKCYGDTVTPSFENLYLGPEFSKTEIIKILSSHKDQFTYREDISSKEIATLLADGYVIARFDGRMEFGARALGNRSILGDPSKNGVVKKINSQIKNRDFWMPFTASILDKREHDYIINPKKIKSPFMAVAFDSTDLAKDHLREAIHPYDYTVRPQILTKKQNRKYYELIEEFEAITGIGALLNTSFNLHGEPVVCSPQDAIHTFLNSKLDMLLINDILVQR
jgi:carbamoyltransferase